MAGTDEAWERLLRLAQDDPRVQSAVEITLLHATSVVREARPAATSEVTFEGGVRRAVSLLRTLRAEVRPKAPWPDSKEKI